jgi:hypothetical protein
MLSLIGLLTYFAYNDLRNTYQLTQQFIEQQQVKRGLLTKMYSSARERSFILLRMVAEYDDFALDDLNQGLTMQSSKFHRAREQLLSNDLDHNELDLLVEQNEVTFKDTAVQNQVAQLFQAGRREQAQRLLIESALPNQELYLIKKAFRDC